MRFSHRLSYYMGGVFIGIIFLIFFLSGKKASCDYFPSARTKKNILSKNMKFEPQVVNKMSTLEIDTITIRELIKYGDVDFGFSKRGLNKCNEYLVENSYKSQELQIIVKNCDSLATVIKLEKL